MPIRRRLPVDIPPEPIGEQTRELTPASKAQAIYKTRQIARGYVHTRVWLPAELKDWHDVFARRAREWKDYGMPLVLPPLPPGIVIDDN